MFKTFSVAGAAAAAFLCANPAAAEVTQAPAAQATTTTAASAGIETQNATAQPAIFSIAPQPALEAERSDAAPLTGRGRPDRIDGTPSGPGVAATASVQRPLAEMVADHAGSDTRDEQD